MREQRKVRRPSAVGVGEKTRQARHGRLQLVAMHHHVDHAVILEILGALEAVGQFLADGLLDDPRTRKADQGARLGDVHVAQHRVGGGHAAGGRVGEDHDVRQPCVAKTANRRPSCAASA